MEQVNGNVHLLSGKIRGQNHDHVCCVVGDEELAEWFKQFVGKIVTVRYWVNDKKLKSVEEAVEKTLEEAFGQGPCHATCIHHGSEITGYLYTTEELMVGGHDIIAELESWEGKFALMEVTVHEPEEPVYHPNDCRSEEHREKKPVKATDALLALLRGEPIERL